MKNFGSPPTIIMNCLFLTVFVSRAISRKVKTHMSALQFVGRHDNYKSLNKFAKRPLIIVMTDYARFSTSPQALDIFFV